MCRVSQQGHVCDVLIMVTIGELAFIRCRGATSQIHACEASAGWREVLIESAELLSHIVRMGRVTVTLKLTNLYDLAVKSRHLTNKKPRQVQVRALVDTGATRLYLKPSVIQRLGLQRVGAVRSNTTNGEVVRFKYEPVQLELLGRQENFDVIEVPESVPNLLGQVPLEVLDLVVDSKRQKLIGNPAHRGEQMTEEY